LTNCFKKSTKAGVVEHLQKKKLEAMKGLSLNAENYEDYIPLMPIKNTIYAY